MRQLNKKEIKRKYKEFPKRDKEIYLILENIEYARNVASIFRTAEAAGVRKLYLTGISKTPPFGKELRQVSRNKEKSVEWIYKENSGEAISSLKRQGFYICAVELTDSSVTLGRLKDVLRGKDKVCFVAGSEVFGIKKSTLENCDIGVEIPMFGKLASLNVSVSVGIVLYSF
ncbi:tRNA methyltransferase [Candidatus Dojkabacteria bacterium]|nr:tRNA methyltransferase [Candidatus Dojkabacteria bacterium]